MNAYSYRLSKRAIARRILWEDSHCQYTSYSLVQCRKCRQVVLLEHEHERAYTRESRFREMFRKYEVLDSCPRCSLPFPDAALDALSPECCILTLSEVTLSWWKWALPKRQRRRKRRPRTGGAG